MAPALIMAPALASSKSSQISCLFARLSSPEGPHDGAASTAAQQWPQPRRVGRASEFAARSEGVGEVTGDIHADNSAMQVIARKVGFKITRDLGDPAVSAALKLEP